MTGEHAAAVAISASDMENLALHCPAHVRLLADNRAKLLRDVETFIRQHIEETMEPEERIRALEQRTPAEDARAKSRAASVPRDNDLIEDAQDGMAAAMASLNRGERNPRCPPHKWHAQQKGCYWCGEPKP
jgi:hypothetical protein